MWLRDNNINLRKEFKMLQNDFSIDILYIRSTKYVRCKCFNPLYKTGDPKCNICFGNGHLTSIEKSRVISHSVSSHGTQNLTEPTKLGTVVKGIDVCYFDYSMLPKEKDIVVVAGWDKHGLPTEAIRVYEIAGVDEVRGDNGRIEFYSVTTKLKPDLLGQVKNTINKLPYGAKRILAERKRYVWPIKR